MHIKESKIKHSNSNKQAKEANQAKQAIADLKSLVPTCNTHIQEDTHK